jgi:hypothetical protein
MTVAIETYLHIAFADAEDTGIPAYRSLEAEAAHSPKTLLVDYEAVHTFDQGPIPVVQPVQAYKAAQVPANRIHLHSLHRPSFVLE